MALTFDTSTVDKEKYPFIITDEKNQLGHNNPITEAVIWLSLVTGSPSRQSPEQWAMRARIWEKVAGASVFDYDEETGRTPHFLTVEELFDHAGVATNATVLTAAEFRKRVYECLETDAKYDVQRHVRESEKAEA